MLTFGLDRSLHCKSTGKLPLPVTVALFGLGFEKGSPVSLFVNDFSALSGKFSLSSDCSELAHAVLVAEQMLFGVFRFAQPDKLQPVHFKLAIQQSCSGLP